MKETVYQKARELAKRRPDLKAQIKDIVEEMNDEIADGGSETHEAELALSDLNQLEQPPATT
jgi:hypothetical protein